MGVWYDYHSTQESKEPEPQESEPFSLDLHRAISTSNQDMEEATVEEPVAANEDECSVQDKTFQRTVEAEKHTHTHRQTLDETTERQYSVTESSDKAKTKKGSHQTNL